MIRYLLDTDILSYLMKRRFPQVQTRSAQVLPAEQAISAVTAAEILFGLEALPSLHPARQRAVQFLRAIQVLDWPAEAAANYATLRFKTRHQPLAERDMMIAAHAIAIGATLVTNNTKHFGRIGAPLHLDNWLW